jgi:hypothetical protein
MPIARIHKTPSPYNASELALLDYEQMADVLYLAHDNHPPTKLIREANDSWSFETVSFGPTIDPPAGVGVTPTVANTDSANGGNAYAPKVDAYVITVFDEISGQESRASSSASATNDLSLKRNFNTVSWGAVTLASGAIPLYRIYKKEEKQEYGYIGATTELSFVDRNIGADLSEGPPVGDNPFANAGDYPATVTFHEQRSLWGRTINRPNGIWASRSADQENMDFRRPLREDDAFAIGLVANKVNAVNQLVSTKHGLLALTSNNIFTILGANGDYLAAAPPPKAAPEIARGVSRLNPISVDNVVFYQTAKGSSVHTVGFQWQLDSVRTDDITIFARHLFENMSIVDWAYAEKPASAIWAVRGDGKLLCLTWDQAQEVWGWTLCYTGELDADGNAIDKFEGVCVIYEGSEDRAYFIVNRTIEGVQRRFVERMASELWEDQQDACYLDCARTFTNAEPVSIVDRLDHLEGKTLKALVDGNVVKGLLVTNGSVTLPDAGSIITIGLPFTAQIQTLPLAIQTGQGWNIDHVQQAGHVVARVINTRGILAGPDEDQLFAVKDRDQEELGTSTDLLTGSYQIDMAGTSGTETTVIIQSPDPLPMHVAAVLIEPQISPDS